MKTYTLHIQGMHCRSCKILIEDTLNEQIGISNAQVDLGKAEVTFDTDLHERKSELAAMLTEKISHNGYSLSVEKITKKKQDAAVIWQAIPIGLVILALFFLLQKSGILNFGIGGQITPASSFLVGVIASVSSCLAVVGGLVLSLSAQVSQDADTSSDKKNITLFHAGRILGFALLGGLLGALGGAISINPTLTGVLGLLTAVIMILLGANLVGIFAQSKVTLPTGIFRFFKKMEHRALTPLIIGFATFFLPCGFTQAMQVAALSSGTFVGGGLIMLAFALGTFPVLALLSFGAASFAQSRHAPLFFKTAGVVVIGLGIFALLA